MNQERVVPQNIEAEDSLIGAALLDATAFAITVTQVEPADFYRTANATIATALGRMWTRGERKADPVLVADELKDYGDLEKAGGTNALTALLVNTPATSNAERYAKIVQEKSLLRRVMNAGLAITDLALETPDIAKAVTDAKALVNELDLPIGATEPSPHVLDFLDLETKQDWLVPGLLERRDRLVLTATEGAGKSTLIRQLAVQFASGIHPFENRFIEPIKVLIIDLENSMPQIQRALRLLVVSAKENLVPENLRIEVRPEGLDLQNRHDVRWLYDRVAMAAPDVVCIGPIYKLHNDNPNDELPARRVAGVLDELRSRYGCALMIEAHSPQGSTGTRALRPIGSSLWLRWPEFGLGLRRMKTDHARYRFEEWRGARDQRAWPEFLRRGGAWPWTAEPRQQQMI